MPYTFVLAGPADRRPQVIAAMRQLGAKVEDSTRLVKSRRGDTPTHSYDHGFEALPGEEFVTAYAGPEILEAPDPQSPSRLEGLLTPFGWRPLMHFQASQGSWDKVGAKREPDIGSREWLAAELKALGVQIPGAS